MTLWAVTARAADPTSAETSRVATAAANAPSQIATDKVVEAPVPGPLYTNSIGMECLKMPGGFWAGKYEVTQKQYQKVMAANPSEFAGETQPVENVIWDEAMQFCQKLTELELKNKAMPAGYHYMLPTEDEWLSLVADASLETAVTSISRATRSAPSTVGSLGANSLGLYDVRGNVMEFCLTDPAQPFRILKGGSWRDFVEVNLRPEFRWYCKPDERQNTFGFRCVLKAN